MKLKAGSLRRSKNWQTFSVSCRLWKTTEKSQIIKIRNESRDITSDSTEIKRIIREYCEPLYVNTLDNLDEIDKSLETKPTKTVLWRNFKNMNRYIISKVIKSLIKNFPTKKVWILPNI